MRLSKACRTVRATIGVLIWLTAHASVSSAYEVTSVSNSKTNTFHAVSDEFGTALVDYDRDITVRYNIAKDGKVMKIISEYGTTRLTVDDSMGRLKVEFEKNGRTVTSSFQRNIPAKYYRLVALTSQKRSPLFFNDASGDEIPDSQDVASVANFSKLPICNESSSIDFLQNERPMLKAKACFDSNISKCDRSKKEKIIRIISALSDGSTPGQLLSCLKGISGYRKDNYESIPGIVEEALTSPVKPLRFSCVDEAKSSYSNQEIRIGKDAFPSEHQMNDKVLSRVLSHELLHSAQRLSEFEVTELMKCCGDGKNHPNDCSILKMFNNVNDAIRFGVTNSEPFYTKFAIAGASDQKREAIKSLACRLRGQTSVESQTQTLSDLCVEIKNPASTCPRVVRLIHISDDDCPNHDVTVTPMRSTTASTAITRPEVVTDPSIPDVPTKILFQPGDESQLGSLRVALARNRAAQRNLATSAVSATMKVLKQIRPNLISTAEAMPKQTSQSQKDTALDGIYEAQILSIGENGTKFAGPNGTTITMRPISFDGAGDDSKPAVQASTTSGRSSNSLGDDESSTGGDIKSGKATRSSAGAKSNSTSGANAGLVDASSAGGGVSSSPGRQSASVAAPLGQGNSDSASPTNKWDQSLKLPSDVSRILLKSQNPNKYLIDSDFLLRAEQLHVKILQSGRAFTHPLRVEKVIDLGDAGTHNGRSE